MGPLLGDAKTAQADVVAASLHQHRPELVRQHRLQERNVLANELFLQANRVRGDDDPEVLVGRGGEDGRHEIGEALAHARACFDEQMLPLHQRPRHGHGHLLLLRPIFEIARFREDAAGRKDLFDLRDEVGGGGFCGVQCDHKISTGRTFSTMPQSNSQTSPRRGVILFLVQHGGQLIPCRGDLRVVQRAGIERRQPAKQLFHELPLFRGCKRFVLREQLSSC